MIGKTFSRKHVLRAITEYEKYLVEINLRAEPKPNFVTVIQQGIKREAVELARRPGSIL